MGRIGPRSHILKLQFSVNEMGRTRGRRAILESTGHPPPRDSSECEQRLPDFRFASLESHAYHYADHSIWGDTGLLSAIQRLLVLFALIAASIAFVAPADASVAPLHPAWTDVTVSSLAGSNDADKVAASLANKKKIPCAPNAERSHKPCPVCSKSVVLRSMNRTRTRMPGLQPTAVTGVPVYAQFAAAAELASRSLNLARLAFLQKDFAFGDVFARTRRLRI